MKLIPKIPEELQGKRIHIATLSDWLWIGEFIVEDPLGRYRPLYGIKKGACMMTWQHQHHVTNILKAAFYRPYDADKDTAFLSYFYDHYGLPEPKENEGLTFGDYDNLLEVLGSSAKLSQIGMRMPIKDDFEVTGCIHLKDVPLAGWLWDNFYRSIWDVLPKWRWILSSIEDHYSVRSPKTHSPLFANLMFRLLRGFYSNHGEVYNFVNMLKWFPGRHPYTYLITGTFTQCCSYEGNEFVVAFGDQDESYYGDTVLSYGDPISPCGAMYSLVFLNDPIKRIKAMSKHIQKREWATSPTFEEQCWWESPKTKVDLLFGMDKYKHTWKDPIEKRNPYKEIFYSLGGKVLDISAMEVLVDMVDALVQEALLGVPHDPNLGKELEPTHYPYFDGKGPEDDDNYDQEYSTW